MLDINVMLVILVRTGGEAVEEFAARGVDLSKNRRARRPIISGRKRI